MVTPTSLPHAQRLCAAGRGAGPFILTGPGERSIQARAANFAAPVRTHLATPQLHQWSV